MSGGNSWRSRSSSCSMASAMASVLPSGWLRTLSSTARWPSAVTIVELRLLTAHDLSEVLDPHRAAFGWRDDQVGDLAWRL